MTAESRFDFFFPKYPASYPMVTSLLLLLKLRMHGAASSLPHTPHSVIVKRMEVLIFGKHTGILQYKWSGIQDLIV
jgi:hypothetical protein